MVLPLLELAREPVGSTFSHTGNGSSLGRDRLVNSLVLVFHGAFYPFLPPNQAVVVRCGSRVVMRHLSFGGESSQAEAHLTKL